MAVQGPHAKRVEPYERKSAITITPMVGGSRTYW